MEGRIPMAEGCLVINFRIPPINPMSVSILEALIHGTRDDLSLVSVNERIPQIGQLNHNTQNFCKFPL